MKILHVINSLGSGGAERLVLDVCGYLKNKNCICEVLVLTNRNDVYKKSFQKIGVNVYFLSNSGLYSILLIKKLFSFMDNNSYDVIHCHLFPTFYYISLYTFFNRNRTKFVFTEHNTNNKRRKIVLLKFIERCIYQNFDLVIAISCSVKINLINWLGAKYLPENKCKVIENGINLCKFQKNEIQSNNDIFNFEKKIVLCMVGSFTEQKNYPLFLEILKQLPDNYVGVLVGNGPLYNKIKKLAIKMELFNRVKFLGYRNDVSRVMSFSDIMVIPSKWEGFGLVAVEAMAIGLPIVYSDLDGLKEVVGENGLKASSKCEFVNNVLKLENKNIYDYYSKKSKIRAQKYSIGKMAFRYLDCYKGLLDE